MRERMVVFRALMVRQLAMMHRYLFNTISGIVTMYIVFMLMFFGARAVTGAGLVGGGASLEALVVGYFVWAFAMAGYQELAWGITNEAQMGTLEKLYLSPVGFRWVNACVLVSMVGLHLLICAVLLGLIMVSTGIYLRLDLVSILPLLMVTVASTYGLGFVMAGLALLFKRVQSAFQILQFLLVAFIAAPQSVWSRFLPLNLGNRMLTQVMVRGVRIWEFPASQLLLLVGVSAAYLAVGLLAFGRMEARARAQGLLGHY